ncbi:unnamed protein product, partial [Urochloa humidicola]
VEEELDAAPVPPRCPSRCRSPSPRAPLLSPSAGSGARRDWRRPVSGEAGLRAPGLAVADVT